MAVANFTASLVLNKNSCRSFTSKSADVNTLTYRPVLPEWCRMDHLKKSV